MKTGLSLSYIIRRLIYIAVTFWGITLITFMIIHLAPGSPMEIPQDDSGIMADKIPPEAYQQMLKLYGLDKPLYQQYFIWLKRMILFDFGNSFFDGRPVTQKILEALPATLQLNIISFILTLLIAPMLGIISAVKQNTFWDKFTTTGVFILYSLPNFWVASLLITFVGVKFNLLPFIGMESDSSQFMGFFPQLWDRILHLILPVFCLTYGSLARLSRYTRSGMLEVIRQDYIRTARAKGLSEKAIIYKHALRNTLIPLVTLLGFMLPGLIGGSVIIERIFSWPGMGRLYFDAVLSRDYPVIMGLSVFSAILVLLGNLVADILYTTVDPRIFYE